MVFIITMMHNLNRELRDAGVGVAITAVILLSLLVIHMLFKSKPGSSPMISLHRRLEKKETETEKKTKVFDCMDSLQLVDEQFFAAVDKHFYEKHPKLKGYQLTNKTKDKKHRLEWYNIAEEILEEEAERLGKEKCY